MTIQNNKRVVKINAFSSSNERTDGFCKKITNKLFQANNLSTLGTDLYTTQIKYQSDKSLEYQLWALNSKIDYFGIHQRFIKGALSTIIIIDSEIDFSSIDKFLQKSFSRDEINNIVIVSDIDCIDRFLEMEYADKFRIIQFTTTEVNQNDFFTKLVKIFKKEIFENII